MQSKFKYHFLKLYQKLLKKIVYKIGICKGKYKGIPPQDLSPARGIYEESISPCK